MVFTSLGPLEGWKCTFQAHKHTSIQTDTNRNTQHENYPQSWLLYYVKTMLFYCFQEHSLTKYCHSSIGTLKAPENNVLIVQLGDRFEWVFLNVMIFSENAWNMVLQFTVSCRTCWYKMCRQFELRQNYVKRRETAFGFKVDILWDFNSDIPIIKKLKTPRVKSWNCEKKGACGNILMFIWRENTVNTGM